MDSVVCFQFLSDPQCMLGINHFFLEVAAKE